MAQQSSQSWPVTDFSPGLNSLYDERALMPNQKGEPAESPYMENVEITAKGSVITSTGFTLVSSLGGGAVGGTLNLITYEKNPTTRFMVITHGTHNYSVNPASFVWTDLGSYGAQATNVGGVVYKGTGAIKRLILGTDNNANTIQLWDGIGATTNLGGVPPKSWIFAEFMGRLFAASNTVPSVFFTDVEDEADWAGGGVVGFNDFPTGLGVQGEFAPVFQKRSADALQFNYDNSFNLSVPLKKPVRVSSGCLAQKTIEGVYNDIYYFSPDGVQRFGNDAQYIAQNLRVNSLSWKINPSLTPNKFNSSAIAKAFGKYFQKKYYFGLPYGNDGFNSKLFVYLWDYDAWTFRSGIYASNFAVMANSAGEDELYFASALGPDLYKFTDNYDYNGGGYNRVYRTKKFNMGSSMNSKWFKWIDLRGSMYQNTTFFVDVNVDGQTQTYKIDSNNLEINNVGGFYGDDFRGAQFLGGQSSGATPFYRFGARLPMTKTLSNGREIQVTIRNANAGEPWKIDYMNFEYEYEDKAKIPIIFQNVNLTT